MVEPYKWDGDAVFQSRLFFKANDDLVAQLKAENSELDSDADFSQTDPTKQVKIKTNCSQDSIGIPILYSGQMATQLLKFLSL